MDNVTLVASAGRSFILTVLLQLISEHGDRIGDITKDSQSDTNSSRI